jgi:hypothetical protein
MLEKKDLCPGTRLGQDQFGQFLIFSRKIDLDNNIRT